MQPYNDIDNDSNIESFEIGNDYIKVKFFHGMTYVYTYASASSHHIEEMKRLANQHDGLNAYINEHKPGYSQKY